MASPRQPPLVGPGSSAEAWELSRSSVVFFDLLLIQKLLTTDVNLEQLLRCPTCGSAGSSGAPLVLDGPAKLRRVCGPDHTYYIHSSKYCHKKCPGQLLLPVSRFWCHVRCICCAPSVMAAADVLPSYQCASSVYTGKANSETCVCGATSFDSKHPSVQRAALSTGGCCSR